MKIKLRCRIFGHDFRRIERCYIYTSEYCNNCGLGKEELKELESK